MPFVEAHGIVKTYSVGQTSLTVLRDLDLSVDGGEMVAIVGASGVGKSTLLHVLGGLDRPEQRVAVGRALVMRPSVLLADEPTGDLDEQTAGSLHGLLREMHRSYHLTSIIATHNTRLAAACDRVLRLQEGQLVEA